MRILLLAADFPPSVGGIQTMLLEIFRRLPDEVTVLAPAEAGAAEADRAQPFSVVRAGTRPRLGVAGLVRMLLRAMWECCARPPDLVVCGHVVTAPIGLLVKRLFRRPYVVFTYAWEVQRKRWSRVIGRVLRGADAVVAISAFTRDAVKRFGVAPDRIHIISPGVDPVRFSPTDGVEVRQRPWRPTLLTVARLNERYKGHDSVIRALPLILAKVPEARYVVAGQGRLQDYLEALARNVGVAEAVVFVGAVPDSDLPRLYRECDVFVLASRNSRTGGGGEGFGIVCLEAAATEKPVVAGRSGALPDTVQDGATGLLVHGDDPLELAEAVVKLLTDSAFAGRLGRAGRRRVLQEMTWEHARDKVQHLFASVATSERSA